MSQQEVDAYLATVADPDRTALSELRDMIMTRLPDAEQCISYGIPGFRVRGKVIAGFGAFAHHLSYFPHSGSVFGQLRSDVSAFQGTKSALHFTAVSPLPHQLVDELLTVRLTEAFGALVLVGEPTLIGCHDGEFADGV